MNAPNNFFLDAEQLWFWFIASKQIRTCLSVGKPSSGKRPCELIDVESLVTKLYLSGQLTNEHLSVMKEFGDKKRVPNIHIYTENPKAYHWRNAMQILEQSFIQRGWVINKKESI